ncbi:MAG: choloylglycine hydrolase family protein [Proteobacteria bacterium]|nr:choloylglycine hydrolase family protein [Pseudomonadota bacterium]
MKVLKNVLFLSILSLCFNKADACSDFQIKAKDGSIVIGRSMEFPVDLHSKLWVVPRSIKNKYAFLGMDSMGKQALISDGMNEKGLSIESLVYGDTKYQTAVPGVKSVPSSDFPTYILGNFETVEEVKKGLNNIRVVGIVIKELGGVQGFHFAIHDAKKNNLVVEFINGEVHIYNNPLGVMTNAPDFNWQISNLSNYINLDSHDKKAFSMNGQNIKSTGVGSGLLGLPGDWTPPSRFVKLSWCVSSANPVKDASAAVNLAEHILNAVDIPIGTIKEAHNLYGYAQWSVIKDLTNKVLYYRTYEDTTLKAVDIKKLNLNMGASPKSIPLKDGSKGIVNITEKLI